MATTTYGSPYVQSSDLVSGWPTASQNVADRIDDVAMKGNGLNAQTGTTYTLVLTDAGKNITRSNGSASTLDIPTNASVAFETGTVVAVTNIGSGAVTIQGSGVTINGPSLVLAQWESARLMKTATDTWVVVKGGGLPKAVVSGTTGSPTVDSSSRPGKTIYKWTGSGSFTVDTAGTVEILVVGPGGGGGYNNGGGGGGGLVIESTAAYFATGTHTVTIGAGGVGTSSNAIGNPSQAGPYIAAAGGPGGGNLAVGKDGGCGGGGGASGSSAGGVSTYSSVDCYGFAGSIGQGASTGGGGGGAGGAPASSKNGNAGRSSSITGSSVTYAGGGGGVNSGTGGSGGGGAGATTGAGAAGTSGTANTGGGGGGGGPSNGNGGSGGSGYVVIVTG